MTLNRFNGLTRLLVTSFILTAFANPALAAQRAAEGDNSDRKASQQTEKQGEHQAEDSAAEPSVPPKFVMGINLSEPFIGADDSMARLDDDLAKARDKGKLLLVIVGADWCHDTMGLIGRFGEPDLQGLLEERYLIHMVDAGVLEHGYDIPRRFGLPLYFATPTVMIIDPHSEKLVNGADMHMWRDADSIKFEDTLAYFQAYKDASWSSPAPSPYEDSPQYARLMSEIDTFYAAQAARVERGYAHVGPIVIQPKETRPENALDLWAELRDLRYRLPDDVANLRAEVRTRLANGEDEFSLSYPNYPAFSWEK